MTPHPFRRALRASLALAAVGTIVPGAAQASTWTVDDDRAQCPNAAFTKIQDAIDQAAPWDTVVVCDGVYEESSAPASATISPSQAGSRNGLTITKPLTLRGTGAGKVTIRPAASIGDTLAGTAPYLRDGGGNVITVSRQAAGVSGDNEMFVNISGVTVESPDAYAEAGIAFFNTSGTITNSVVGPLRRAADAAELAARPHGWGVVMTNHMQGTEAGIRRTLDIKGSLMTGYQSGGVLFDDSRGTDAAATLLQRSGIVAYGTITESRIAGSGPDDLIPQTGVRYHAGQRGSITKSVVTGNYFTPDPRQSVGLLLTDAETGPDPAKPEVRGFWALENQLTQNGYAMFNANIANDAVREGAPAMATPGAVGLENWWGCSGGPVVGGPSAGALLTSCQGISGADTSGAQSIERGTTRTGAPFLPATPAATADAAPTGRFGEPLDGDEVPAGEPVFTIVQAADDFGVKSVELKVDGDTLPTASTAPYEFEWTPGYDQIGDTVALEATITDSAGQTKVVTADVDVVAPAGYTPITVTPASGDFGDVLVGESAEQEVEVENTGENPLKLDEVALTGDAFSAEGDCEADLTLAPGETCSLDVTFAPTEAGAASGALAIAYATPGAGPAETVALTGTGTLPPAPPVVDPPVETPPAPAPPVDTPAPPAEAPPVSTPPASTPPVGGVATTPPGLALRGSATLNRKTRSLTVGTLTCRASRPCSTRVTASVRIAGRTYRLSSTVRAAGGRTVAVRVKLTPVAARALARSKTKRAQLRVTLAAADDLGATSTRSRTLTIRA